MTVKEARLAALAKMRERRIEGGPMHAAMPIDPWRLVSRSFSAEGFGESETMFAVANGYMGMRGTHDEGVPSHDPAFFLNGFHETWPIPYGEAAFGFATTGQTIVSAPDGSVMRTPTRGSSLPSFGRGRCVTSSDAIASSAWPDSSVTS